MSTTWQTPGSSNVVAITIHDDDCVVVEFQSGTYVYTEVTDEAKFALGAALDAGASAGKIVNALLRDEFPYRRMS